MMPTPYWNRNFRRRTDPLTQRFARSLAEACADVDSQHPRDPLTHRFARTTSEAFPRLADDGVEGPFARARARRLANHPLLWALSMLLFCAMLTSPKWWPALFGG